MDIKIKVVSAHDVKKGAASYLYVAEVDGQTGDSIKILKMKENVFSMDEKFKAQSITSNELHSFVKQLKGEFDIEKIKIKAHPHALEHKWFSKNNKDNNVSIEKELDIDNLTFLSKRMFSSLFRHDPSKEVKNIIENKEKKNIDFSVEDLDGFITRLNKKEIMLEDMFKNKILNNDKLENCYINFAYTQDVERKRFGYGIEVYSSFQDLKSGRSPLYRQQIIGHGESNEGFEKLTASIIDKTNKLSKTDKNVTLNVSTPNRHLAGIVHGMIKEKEISSRIKITTAKTEMHEKTELLSGRLIETDIKLHLDRIKDPETVSIWTDGSVNEKKQYSGTGILIKHQGEEEQFSIKNDRNTNNTYAEFKGVYEALKKVVLNDNYKNKKVIIISDNDSMSKSIRRKQKGESCSPQPFLEEICDLFKHFDIDVHFHNVKSHVHEDIKPEDKDKLYDFYYNDVVDELARKAAGLKPKSEVKKDVRYHNRQKRNAF